MGYSIKFCRVPEILPNVIMAQPDDPEAHPGKVLQHTRRGLKMVADENAQKSLFDLNEPIWHADEKVTVWTSLWEGPNYGWFSQTPLF